MSSVLCATFLAELNPWADFLKWEGQSLELDAFLPDGSLWPLTVQLLMSINTLSTGTLSPLLLTEIDALNRTIVSVENAGQKWMHEKSWLIGYHFNKMIKRNIVWGGENFGTIIPVDQWAIKLYDAYDDISIFDGNPLLEKISTPHRLLRKSFIEDAMINHPSIYSWSRNGKIITASEIFDQIFPWLLQVSRSLSAIDPKNKNGDVWRTGFTTTYDTATSVDVPFDDQRFVVQQLDCPMRTWNDYLTLGRDLFGFLQDWSLCNIDTAPVSRSGISVIPVDHVWRETLCDLADEWDRTSQPLSAMNALRQRLRRYLETPCYEGSKDDSCLLDQKTNIESSEALAPAPVSSKVNDEPSSLESPSHGATASDEPAHGPKIARVTTPFKACAHVSERQKAYQVLADDVPLLHVHVNLESWQSSLDQDFPWMRQTTAWLSRRLWIQQTHQQPLKLPNLALMGDPGTGKSQYWIEALTRLDHPWRLQSMNGSNESTMIKGTSAGWSNAMPNLAAIAMSNLKTGNPMVLLDDLDRAGGNDQNGMAWDALLPLLDVGMAQCYMDDCLQETVDASHISWCITLVDDTLLPSALRNRMKVLNTTGPDWSNAQHLDSAFRMAETLAWTYWDPSMNVPEARLSDAQRQTLRSMRWQSLHSLRQAVEETIDENLYQLAVEKHLAQMPTISNEPTSQS